MFCNKCGKEIKEDSVFCNYCGNQMDRIDKVVNDNDKVKYDKNNDSIKVDIEVNKSEKNIQSKLKRPISIVLVVLLGVAFLITLIPLLVFNNSLLAIIIYFPIFIIIAFSLIFVNLKIKSRSLGFLISTCTMVIILIVSSIGFSIIQNKKSAQKATTQNTEKANIATTIQTTTTITTIAESSNSQSKIDDYNDRLEKFNTINIEISTLYSKHWPIIEPLTLLQSNDPEEISSNAKKIVSEFKMWQNEFSEIKMPSFANDMLSYFIDWTLICQEFFTYTGDNPIKFDAAKVADLQAKTSSSLNKAMNEANMIRIAFNQEASSLGLNLPFPDVQSQTEQTTTTEESSTELGTKENPWPFDTVVTGPEVSWELLLAKDLGNKLNSNNMFIEDKTTSGTFIKVEAIIKNVGSTKKDTTFSTFNIVDNKGREFGELPDAYAFTGEDIDTDYIEEINPGMERNYIFIFEVPLDAKGLMFEATDLEMLFPSKTYISLGF